MDDLIKNKKLFESFLSKQEINEQELPKWYIMKAHHLGNGKKSIQDIIFGAAPYSIGILVCETELSKKPVFITSSGPIKTRKVGDRAEIIYDTGMGHRRPKYEDSIVIVQNIINVDKDGQIIDYVNDIGLNEKRGTYVFK